LVTTAETPTVETSEDLARLQIEALEERGAALTLSSLADLYDQFRAASNAYAAVLDQAARLADARRRYDRLLAASTTDGLLAGFRRDGLEVFKPRNTASPGRLREQAAVCARLAGEAREAAKTRPRETLGAAG
jgi:hypothetical protein